MAPMKSVVITGRRMKPSAIFMTISSLAGRRRHGRGVFHLEMRAWKNHDLPVRDNRFAGLQPAGDDRIRPRVPLHAHWSNLRRLIRLQDVDERALLARLDGLRGNDDGICLFRQPHNRIHELPGPEPAVPVRERRFQLNCAGCAIHGVVNKRERSRFRVLRIVGNHRPNSQRTLCHILSHLSQIAFRNRVGHVNGSDLIDYHENGQVICFHEIPGMHQQTAGAAVHRRINGTIIELKPRVLEGRLIGSHSGLILCGGGLGLIELLLGTDFLGIQALRALQDQGGVRRLRFVMREFSERLIERGLKRRAVDRKQQIALFDVLAFFEMNAQELARDLGLDRDGSVGHHRANGLYLERDALLRYLSHRDGHRRRAGRCTSQQAAAPGAPTVPVTVAQVAKKSVPLEIEAIGSVMPYRTVSVEPQVTGQLLSVHFKEGQDVKKGDLLFSIDRAPFQAALDQALGKLAHDKAQAANSALILQRTQRLDAEKISSKEQLDQAQAAAAQDQAAVRTDEAALEYARLQLNYCSVYSPVDGRTGSLLVHPGNLVKANDLPVLVVINQVTPVYVAYAIPERYLAEVRKYMAKGSLGVGAVILDDPQHPEAGTLTFVDNTVDRATGTIQLKATFPNRNRRLWPGQFVNTIVRLAEQTNAIVVPSQAVETGQKGTFVYVLKADQTAEIRPVSVERNAGADAVVSSGLQPGETVVTDGQIMIFPGAHLQVKNSAPMPPAASK